MKGRPPLEPRIRELEDDMRVMKKALEALDEALRAVEAQSKIMQRALLSIPLPKTTDYVPVFERWENLR